MLTSASTFVSFGIRHTAVDQHRTTVLRYHARSVGSRTCTVRAETTQDGTIHAWMVCICHLGSVQTAVVEMCLIGTRGCALSLSTCRVKFRDTQRASSSQTAAWRIGGSPNLIIASCNGLRAIQCGRAVLGNHCIAPLVACTRTHFDVQERCTGHVLSTSSDTVHHAHLDYARHTRTFRYPPSARSATGFLTVF